MGKKSGGRVRVKQVGPKMPPNPLSDLAVPPDEMIHLPPKADSDSGFLIWPMGETFTMNYRQFATVHPNYLDSEKSIKLGRRIAASDAIPAPTVRDLHEALVMLSIRHCVQPHKGYSRDAASRWENPGRVLVDLEGASDSGVLDGDAGAGALGADGEFDLDDAIPNLEGDDGDGSGRDGGVKKRLLRKLAAIIRGLPSRIERLKEERKKEDEEKRKALEAEKSAAAGASSGGGSGGGGGNRKKKGKKKK